MLNYILRKLAYLVPTVIGISICAFAFVRLLPGDPILAMAGEMAGGDERAAIWFKHQPIPGWAGKTAYDLVGEGKADKVLAYLEAVRSGVYA